MHASDQELENLKRLQHIDAEVIRNKKKLDELPQRQTILETRQKLSAIIKKKTQVQDMNCMLCSQKTNVLRRSNKRPKKRSIG